MSLDANVARLTKIGRVVIEEDGFVVVDGFEGQNCTCRDIAVLAAAHALGVLQREMLATIEEPGGGRIGIG